MQERSFCSRIFAASIGTSSLLIALLCGNCDSRAAGFLDSWQEMIPFEGPLEGVAYGGGHFVAAGSSGELLASTNAVDWQRGAIPVAGLITDVTYGNGLFLAVGSVSNQLGLALVSSNALDWTTNIVCPSRLDNCAFGNGLFVVASYSSLLSSPDGVQWTSRTSGLLSVSGVDFVGDHFVAVGPGGQRTTSPDGINWSPPTPADGPGLRAAAFGNGTTVMVGDSRRIRTTSATNSADTWGLPDIDIAIDLRDVTFGNGRFVAVGWISDFYLGVIWTSTDGFVWASPCFGKFGMLERVAYGNGMFVAVGNAGTVVTSSDGLDWTIRRGRVPGQMFSAATGKGTVVAVGGGYNAVGTALILGSDGSWHCPDWDYSVFPDRVIYTNEQFLAVGSPGTVSTSPDGAHWTHRTSANTDWLTDVTYGQGVYLVVGYSGQIERSADGITWTNQSVAPGTHFNGVAYGNGRFVVVGADGEAFFSSDGWTWTHSTAGVTNWLNALAFGNGVFVAVGGEGTIVRSSDGQTWTRQASPTSKWLPGLRCLGGRFLAVGEGGTILSSIDGISWQQHSSGVTETFNDVALADNRFFVFGEFGSVLVSEHAVYPNLQALNWAPDLGFQFKLQADLGRPCRLQASSNLAAWQDLGVLPFSDTNHIYLDSTATNQPLRFYRVVAE